MRLLGVDLAWGEGTQDKPANRSGVVALSRDGEVLDAGWTSGLPGTFEWMKRWATEPTLAFVDAPLVITNADGLRDCERQVGQSYGHLLVSANSTNLASPRQAGLHLREKLTASPWRYDPGFEGPPRTGLVVSECYPYTTLVGAREFGFAPRPAYKRPPKRTPMRDFWPQRLEAWNAIVEKLDSLKTADPPLHLDSHPATKALRDTPTAGKSAAYKQAEDLLDAVICAWTAALWARHGPSRCTVLGTPGTAAELAATIIAPTLDTVTSL